jgi:outer membrane immunogenic protein
MREHSDMGIFRSRTVALAVLVGALVPAVPAVADDGVGPGAYRPYYPGIWQGLYAGVNAGWGWSGDASGVIGGGQIGYNWQSNQFVYGLEGDISAADVGVSGSVMFINYSGSIDFVTTVRGRAGVLVQPNLLLYATAGVGVVHWRTHADIPGFGTLLNTSGTETGLVYGIGVESKWTERMTWRLEYLGFNEGDRVGDFGVLRAGLNFKLGQ